MHQGTAAGALGAKLVRDVVASASLPPWMDEGHGSVLGLSLCQGCINATLLRHLFSPLIPSLFPLLFYCVVPSGREDVMRDDYAQFEFELCFCLLPCMCVCFPRALPYFYISDFHQEILLRLDTFSTTLYFKSFISTLTSRAPIKVWWASLTLAVDSC